MATRTMSAPQQAGPRGERQAWRAHHCALLSGDWSGKSVRTLPSGGVVETVWASTRMHWDPSTGQLKGEGVSLWQAGQGQGPGQQGESQQLSFPFDLLGAFSASLHSVELLKSHRGGGTVTHLACTLDLATHSLTGQFADAHGGGSLLLQRVGSSSTPPFSSIVPNMQRSASGSSGTSMSSHAALSPAEVPADLAAFLSLAFPDAPMVAAKIHATLLANEIHEAESLTTFGADEWKELGIVLGHRSKIKLALARCFPHLMKQQLGGVGEGEGPPGALAGAGVAPTPSSSVSPTLSQQQSQVSDGSANPAYAHQPMQQPSQQGYGGPQQQYGGPPSQQSHFMQMQGSQSYPQQAQQGGYGAPSVPPPQYGGGVVSSLPPPSSIPLEFLCPITRDVMVDPVQLVGDGHSYEHASLKQWLEGNKTSPITGKILPSKQMRPNAPLRNAIHMWKQQTYQMK